MKKLFFVIMVMLVSVPHSANAIYYNYSSFIVPGSTSTSASSISDLGYIVGRYTISNIDHGFIYNGSTYSTFDYPNAQGTTITGINDKGWLSLVVSGNQVNYETSYIYNGSNYTSVNYAGSYSTIILDINNAGQAIGYYKNSAYGTLHSFFWESSVFKEIYYPGSVYTLVYGMNNKGDVVGNYWNGSTYNAFLYSGGKYSTLPNYGDNEMHASDINDSGLIVGNISSPTMGNHVFLYDGKNYETISNLVNTNALEINNLGQVVGLDESHGDQRGFFATPKASTVPEPAVTCLLVSGILSLFGVRRKIRK